MRFLADIVADVRFTGRMLGRNSGAFAVAIASLALGIGASSAIFSLVYAVLLDPYPYKNADQIIAPTFSDAGARTGRIWYTIPDYLEIKAHSSTLEDVFLSDQREFVATTGLTERVKGFAESPNFFQFMGVPALMGRVFGPGDMPVAADPPDIAVISYLFWQRRFRGDPKAVGSVLELNRQRYSIIGILPPRFTWGDGDVYVPLAMVPDSHKVMSLMGRVKPGAGLSAVDAELQTFTTRFAKRLPGVYPKQFKIAVQRLNVWLLGKFQGTLIVLLTAVGFLLLIACANVTILLLARATARRKEVALRISLGAPRSRILQQLLTESVVLALAGGMLGVAFAFAGVPAIVALMPEYSVPHEAVIQVNGMVLLFTVAISVAVGILFGMAPALQLAKRDVREAMEESGRSFAGSMRGGVTRSLLIVSEVALTLVLLAGAGIAIRGFIALTQSRLGFDPSHVLVLSVNLTEGAYKSWETRSSYYERVLEKLESTPGVESATATTTAMPPWIGYEAPFDMPGLAANPSRKILIGLIGSGYFSTIHVPLLEGRLFAGADLQSSRPLAIINEEMRRRYWPGGRSPIGLRIHLPEFSFAGNPYLLTPPGTSQWFEIVGVVATARNRGLRDAPMPAIYLPFTLVVPPGCEYLVRVHGDPHAFVHDLTAQMHAVDPGQPITQTLTLDESLARSERAYPRFSTMLFSIFAAVGLLLAGAGIYSVVSYVVTSRTHEFGIRMALGARGRDVLRLVFGMLMRLMLMGIAAGVVLTFVLGRVISGYIMDWNLNDPIAFGSVIVVLLAIGLAAGWLPSRRASSIEPMAALRQE
ncbi:MAG TPA: ABC transporter permease [Bryobacteraceae bacterium]|nr:ABC transporter permease [Bryobacteraceae bacterium]